MGDTPSRRRWFILGIGVASQASGSTFLYGLPFVLPQLRDDVGGSLAQAGLLAACPTIGLMCTLILWGWIADLRGERLVLTVGLLMAAAFLVVVQFTNDVVTLGVVLALAGAGAASANAASGRVVMGWFGPEQRGLAMGVRQTSQPLGVGIAAVSLPLLAHAGDYRLALLLPAGMCAAVGILALIIVRDPANDPADAQEPATSPYRQAPIWRVHGASALLVVPQFTVASFAYLYLVEAHHFKPGAAGAVLGATQLVGAAGRLVAGRWSDVVGSRLVPLRKLSIANAVTMAALTLAVALDSVLAIPILILAAVITVSGNGLAFTSVAEIAGRAWSGRAMGTQNTAQNLVAAITPAAIGGLIAATSFTGGFAAAIVFPLLAVFTIPIHANRA